jgi:diguanylate cyclase (GGDEF)-like protein/PAS domain S-box-containing protein
MKTPLNVLFVEDSEDDAFLMKRELQRGGFEISSHRVDTISGMRAALKNRRWDLVISDYNLPGFDGLHALKIFKSFGLDVPFLLISGAVGEEFAVEAMRAGAQDYIKKDNLSRLVPAINRELREVQVRSERIKAIELLDASETRFRTLVENIPIGVFRCKLGFPGNIIMANPAFLSIFGLDTVSDLESVTMADLFYEPLDQARFMEILLAKGRITSDEWLFKQRDNTLIWGTVTAQVGQATADSDLYIDCTIEDISARIQSQKLQDALYQIAHSANNTQTLDELVHNIHDIIGGLMNASNFYLALLDEQTQTINFPYFIDEKDNDTSPIQYGEGLTTIVIERGEPLLISPDHYDALLEEAVLKPVGTQPIDWLGVPLRNRNNKTIGALVVQSYSERSRYTENDRIILSFVSSQVAVAIERKQAEEALRRSEARQRALLNAIPDFIMVLDQKGTVKDYKETFGMNLFSTNEIIGKSIMEIVSQEIAQKMIVNAEAVLQSNQIRLFEFELTRTEGIASICNYEARMSPSSDSQVLTLIRDISVQRQAAKRMEEQRALLRQVIDINPNLIFAKDKNGKFVLANQAVADVYGTTVDKLIGKTDEDFNPNDQEVMNFRKDDLEVIDTMQEKFIQEEIITDAQGVEHRLQTVKLPLINPGSSEIQVLGVSTDITYSFQDSLTNLPNRRVFLDRLGLVLRRLRRFGDTYSAVLMLDLDRFAMVNESFGHAMGDELLIQAAQRLITCLRTADSIARLGGDEFAILVEDLESVNSITQIAERVLAEISAPFDLDNQRVVVSVSIGIVLCSPDYLPEHVLRDADIALHRAKAAGKARYELFKETMRENVRNNLALETDLRQAIDKEELQVHYEPIINLEKGEVISLEALLRWHHRDRGLVKPNKFIPLAEETGLIVPIGDWILRAACTHMKQWHDTHPSARSIGVSVNLSTKQFLQDNLVVRIEKIINETGLDPRYLQLEITESVIIENEEQVIEALEKFRNMGIRIFLDDFGTGYSSLVYLHKLPLNAIKIDRSFVSGQGDRLNGLEIVRTIIHLANDLHLETIAEGVETPEQLTLLRGMGCTYVQGFLFAETMSKQATDVFIRNQPKFNWKS